MSESGDGDEWVLVEDRISGFEESCFPASSVVHVVNVTVDDQLDLRVLPTSTHGEYVAIVPEPRAV